MTDEELDMVRAQEAWRLLGGRSGSPPRQEAVIAARLAREGWTPPDPLEDEIAQLLTQIKNVNGILPSDWLEDHTRRSVERGIEIGAQGAADIAKASR